MKNNIIFYYYNSIKHFKSAKVYLNDINALGFVLDDFSREGAIKIIKPVVTRYKPYLNQIGQLLTGITVVNGRGAYTKQIKENDRLYSELIYLMRCIMIIGAVNVGIEQSIENAIKKIKSENLNLFSLNYL